MKINSVYGDGYEPRIFQINISDGGVPKQAVQSVEVLPIGLVGDRQGSLPVHGGEDRAVTLYALERILGLQLEGHPVFPGALGENLTVVGINWDEIIPGSKMKLGDQLIIEVAKYATPCNSLVPYLLDGDYGRVSQSHFPGWSRVCSRVIVPGKIFVSDRIELL